MRRFFQNAKVAKQCHIYTMLNGAAKQRHLSFHTPGHKVSAWDITELSFSDCLAHPTDCLLRARQDVENILGAAACEFLTDGSTSGVYTLLYLLKEKGVNRLAVSPFSHVSVFRACALFGIKPVLIAGQTDGMRQPTGEQMRDALARADGLLLTSPNYYGNVAELHTARQLCDECGKPLVIDGAHGSHLHGDKERYAGYFADGWVDGVHKSSPAMTQGAIVCVGRKDWVDDLRRITPLFRTTSPSYPVLASVEYAVKYPKNEVLAREATLFLQSDGNRLYFGGDWTKICCLFGKRANAAQAWFEKRGIYPEFCDGRYLLFYLSSATGLSCFRTLKKAIRRAFTLFPCDGETLSRASDDVCASVGETEWIETEKAVGRVAAKDCGLFPPCTPLVVAGSVFDEDAVRRIKEGKHTFGVEDGKVCVYKGETKCNGEN